MLSFTLLSGLCPLSVCSCHSVSGKQASKLFLPLFFFFLQCSTLCAGFHFLVMTQCCTQVDALLSICASVSLFLFFNPLPLLFLNFGYHLLSHVFVTFVSFPPVLPSIPFCTLSERRKSLPLLLKHCVGSCLTHTKERKERIK